MCVCVCLNVGYYRLVVILSVLSVFTDCLSVCTVIFPVYACPPLQVSIMLLKSVLCCPLSVLSLVSLSLLSYYYYHYHTVVIILIIIFILDIIILVSVSVTNLKSLFIKYS